MGDVPWWGTKEAQSSELKGRKSLLRQEWDGFIGRDRASR
jgi:hypothetical protein